MNPQSAPNPSPAAAPTSGMLNFSSLHQAAKGLFDDSLPESTTLTWALTFLLQHTGALVVLLFRQENAGGPLQIESHLPELPSERAFIVAARSSSAQALREGQPQTGHLARPGTAVELLCCPIILEGATPRVLSLILSADRAQTRDAALLLLQWVADGLKNQQERAAAARRRAQLEEALQNAAALSELLTRTSAASDLTHSLHAMVNELRHALGCEMVALARWRFGRCKAVAISGTHDLSKRGDAHQAVEMLLQSVMQQRRELSSLSGDQFNSRIRETSPYLQELEELFGAHQFFAAPLITEAGQLHGAWLFTWNGEQTPTEAQQNFIRAANAHTATHLALLYRGQPGVLGGTVNRLWQQATATQRRATIVGLSLLVGLLMWPIHYRVKAPCELQPVTRRVVAAPFDSILRKALVKAGQTVSEGTLLAEMDGKEIRWQYAEVVAKHARAIKQAEKATTQGDIANATMSELEAASLDQERQLLEFRRDHLLIHSPISGTVISGDLERTEGVPLKTGDLLFEIAPLDQMLIEVLVDEEEMALVSPGMEVEVRLESDPGKKWEGHIRRVNPRSELRASRNVFVCEALVQNQGQLLRPGMKGAARIYTHRRPLVWNITRGAWNYLRLRLW